MHRWARLTKDQMSVDNQQRSEYDSLNIASVKGRLPKQELSSGTCLEPQASTCAGIRECVDQPKMLRALIWPGNLGDHILFP